MRFGICIALAVPGLVFAASPSRAHERVPAGPYEFSMGWGEEPPLAGFQNRVQLKLSQGGRPVVDLGDTLKVEVIFGDRKMGPLPLEPQFKPGVFGEPGDYGAPIIPNRAGVYTFHVIGEVKGEKIDKTFTSSETTFDSVLDSGSVQFPRTIRP